MSDRQAGDDRPTDDRPTVLVPVRVLAGESIPEGVPALLAHAHVVVLGYHVIPEQTAPGQARMQFETQAITRLDELDELFTDAGATVERRLVFTHDGQKTINRTIIETDALAVLVPDTTGPPEDVLVAVRGTVGIDRLARVVAGVFGPFETTVTLFHVADDEETETDAQMLLDTLTERLVELGVDEAAIRHRIERGEDALDRIVETGGSFDAIVMGETDPSIATFVFGMPAEQLADRFIGPVFVVQREPPAIDDESNDNESNDEPTGDTPIDEEADDDGVTDGEATGTE